MCSFLYLFVSLHFAIDESATSTMGPAQHIGTILHPAHVNLGLYDSDHWPSLHSLLEYVSDISKTSEKNIQASLPHAQHVGGISCPRFDVREAADAFFVEGEFPGIGDRNRISVERLGQRGLLIEAHSSKLNVEEEWNFSSRQRQTNSFTAPVPLGKDLDEKSRTDTASPQPALDPQGVNDVPTGGVPSNSVWRESQRNKETKTQLKDLISERETGCLQRSFTFPVPVDCSGLQARLKDGLLKIRVPKAMVAHQRERLAISVED